MSDVIETIDHPFWGQIQRRNGCEGWDVEIIGILPDRREISIRAGFDDPDDTIVQANYSAIRSRWAELWPRILERTHEEKSAYGFGEVPFNCPRDWFSLRLPREPIETGAGWSVMLQADEAGWLLDFEGWEDAGGQGVF